MKHFLIASAVTLAFSGASWAADPSDVSPASDASAPHTWSGFYIGLQAGGQHHVADFIDPVAVFFGDYEFTGLVGGAHAGFNWQSGAFVFGVEGDIEFADGDGFDVADNTAAVFGRAEANWQGSVRGRLGYAADNVLIYATGGLAFADYDFDYTFPTATSWADEFSETVLGYTVGGGVEIGLEGSGYWSIGMDYRYTDYETASGSIVNCCAAPPFRQDHDMTTHAVRFRVTRRLGGM